MAETNWARKFAHSSFSSLVHFLLPKDNLFKNLFTDGRGHGLYFPNNIEFLSLKIVLVLANSTDPMNCITSDNEIGSY